MIIVLIVVDRGFTTLVASVVICYLEFAKNTDINLTRCSNITSVTMFWQNCDFHHDLGRLSFRKIASVHCGDLGKLRLSYMFQKKISI
jgi:hypothetical protein